MKTLEEINKKIKQGRAVVFTAEEIVDFAKENGIRKTLQKIDVVTTATFGPMCSSGIYFNTGHSLPRIKFGGGSVTLNNVPCYAGFVAVDLFLGAAAIPADDPRNSIYPGEFKYGGAHVINDLLKGKEVVLKAQTYGTDCYPRKALAAKISLKNLNEAVLFNLRNCYQNYNVAVNSSGRPIYTYMGLLKPNFGNAVYCSAASLSPLLNDPFYKTIGVGTRIFLGGAEGYVAWWGTQHNPGVKRNKKGIPLGGAGTLALIGDLKQMSPKWLVPLSMCGYGVSMAIGIGIPIPILNEEILRYTLIEDKDISAPVVDYAKDYPQRKNKVLGYVNYAQLKSGQITLGARKISTGSLSSLKKAREIAVILKSWIKKGKFSLTQYVKPLPGAGSNYNFKPLKEKKTDA